MEVRVLKYFLTVAREENITRAAEILHISQPALSRQLMQLEEELGTQLFVRGRHSSALTEAGMLLRRRAQEIVDLTEKTENEFQNKGETLTGTISIGSGEGYTMRFLAEAMREFSDIYPEVKFDIYSNDADYVRERLERGSVDIGILLGAADISKYESITLPVKERWGVIVPKKCPLFEKEYVTREDLVDRRIFIAKRGVAQGVAEWFGEYYDKMNIYATYNLLYNAATLVDCGIGAAISIEGAASLYHNPNMSFKPFIPELTVSSVMVWKKHQPQAEAVAKFIEFIEQRLNAQSNQESAE